MRTCVAYDFTRPRDRRSIPRGQTNKSERATLCVSHTKIYNLTTGMGTQA